ncbi:beta-amyrin 24-hydroxylase [Quercus suber]|uniref:Beta-amyrin 24-hydroxylase n=1 Tax=Quercus suber TaxID=58331 RepID=A0AAW0LI45_QUESU
MSYYFLFFIWFIVAFFVHSFIKSCFNSRPAIQNPPSPPALPIIGHLHLLGSVLPKSFQTLARRYGPLMQLRMGATTCVVVSSANVAREIYKTQDLNFAYRPKFSISDYSIYKGSSFAMAPYGDYWRFMKKLCMTRLLAVPQLNHTIDIREEEVEKLVERITKFSREGKPCDLRGELTTLTNNVICIMVMSTRCSGNEIDAEEIRGVVKQFMDLAGKLSAGDALGPLRILDFSGNKKKFVRVMEQFDRLLERIMKEHEAKVMNGGVGDQKNDLMDILIETQRDPSAEVKISRQDIKSFLLGLVLKWKNHLFVTPSHALLNPI